VTDPTVVTRSVPGGPALGFPVARHHPAVVAHEIARAQDVQVRVADLITRFAGSMPFVYAHVVAFAGWMLLVERSPWPTLTLVVSLEAIFLSTFVMIGQNRQAAFQQAKADHDFLAQEVELHGNTESMRVIERHVREIHESVIVAPTRA
jgi:uncharacterized membrane protein